VTSGPPRDDGSSGEGTHLVLELALADGDPVRGTVGVPGGSPPVPFCGWIDLMSAINSLRGGTEEPHEQH
jgi:hypothetical protein